MPVPFLGRLNISEYVALIGSFMLVGLEAFVRVFTLALPSSLLALLYRLSRRIFNRWTSPQQKRAEERRKSVSASIRNASDFVDICAMFGYTAEEHVVQTKDGYLLGVHRLAWRKGEEDTKVNRGPNSVKKRVVYLHHGLLMNSEVWVCLTDAQRALPFALVERGFDVWLGNNRGNKYSKKSVNCSPTSLKFWNFSIDEFAFHDIPDTIKYILETTGQPSLSYIGFSQGTAQAFASLAVHPKLNDQVNVFIALAPAMSPAGLSNGIVDALVKASPQVLYLLFGRRSILSSATMWQSILYPPLFTKVIDTGLTFLFNWKTRNISTSQKLAAYPHLYSFTSTKSVVHWFQIIRTKSFQMYDDDVQPPLLLSTSSKYTKVAKYPTRNIKTPIVLVYGGSDSLVDIKVMLRELPSQTVATEIPHYEHLDFLWARDVDAQVFQHVFDALESFTGAEHTPEEYERYHSARVTSLHQSAKTGAPTGNGTAGSSTGVMYISGSDHLGHRRVTSGGSLMGTQANQGSDSTAADSDVSTAVEGAISAGEELEFASGPDMGTRKVVAASRRPLSRPHQAREYERPVSSPAISGAGSPRPVSAGGYPHQFNANIKSRGCRSARSFVSEGDGSNDYRVMLQVGGADLTTPSNHNRSSSRNSAHTFPESVEEEVEEDSGGMDARGGAGMGLDGIISVPTTNGDSNGENGYLRRPSTSESSTGPSPSSTMVSPSPKRKSTGGSHMSFGSMRGGQGISLGASRAVGGVTTSGAHVQVAPMTGGKSDADGAHKGLRKSSYTGTGTLSVKK